jgi:hypothetical protein
MAKDPEVTTEEAVEEFLGEGRVNGSAAFKKAIVNMIGGLAANAGGNTLTTLTPQLISLHTGDPGSTGANEITGAAATAAGYAKKAVTWNPATGGAGDDVATITGTAIQFDVPAGDIRFYGVWQGGTYLYGKALNPQVNLSVAGKVTVTPSHSYGLNP